MSYLFKTDYRQDMTLWRHRGDLFWYGLLGIVLLLIPAMLGMWLGQTLRQRISALWFKRVFFVGMGLLGGHLLISG